MEGKVLEFHRSLEGVRCLEQLQLEVGGTEGVVDLLGKEVHGQIFELKLQLQISDLVLGLLCEGLLLALPTQIGLSFLEFGLI